ncbi:ATPase AAA-type core domain-containing protein OS=Tsukamurella paurometabola (strain ATCC 8368 / DSM / CCUG 35730 / CIP 100753 / JCM 10117 / KCTC 9821 /NBRC 16120 / NCIMB 702349 / NCTC 13040) OX=521096 GN=Tpau_2531 PE=4 SV=1 [Tsukamurella paurometabola]|uniref:ATPase AAA-type core domain-containing protein n=1 Tax=Tsukamurella paurometabola (strain ATCC 8368 / DSM 20162 / CCUG 35730 / CIP 100753 / JCM 10117 / KCTC 9821 / NBRC 16120 / NCIMB 702349 / NCTC 13040) TaxID=521096 RepID=D5URT0_TSUPD|nr:AAA family ATPase [Tsukamurella paurometabola]ADG79135.1 hypothetical protein Tpau_2531 [Tsukamurella paurometabola DSM 20162]SUP34218.1 Predicted ATP-binding protein involved in virulence [Tsukamurella paurometabola]
MYTREAYIHNSGPIKDLYVKFEVDENDRPIPTLFVGRNGAGKTNLLSTLAEPLLLGASKVYDDVLTLKGFGRSYFRILGASTVTTGASNGFAIVKYTNGAESVFYRENAGDISVDDAKSLIPDTLLEGANWDAKESSKEIILNDEAARQVFGNGAYIFFPSNRSETPYWFNTEAIPDQKFDTSDRFRNNLNNPMYVERSLDEFAQWLLGVLAESRLPVLEAAYLAKSEESKVVVTCDTTQFMVGQTPLIQANNILKAITRSSDAAFYWSSRHASSKVGIHKGGVNLWSGLKSLSAGEGTLLSVFGSLLRRSDQLRITPEELTGVAIIDELDAHIHIELQMSALPELIAMFPRIQFIISSHSPFFALGMESKFPGKINIVDLPSGQNINAESYTEFKAALETFYDTRRFEEIVDQRLRESNTPTILVGGTTDRDYFKAASIALGYDDLADLFEWVGEPGGSGGGRNTGDSSLQKAESFIRANPSLVSKDVVILYDCDAKATSSSSGKLHIVPIEQIPGARCSKGVENLLPDSVFTEDAYAIQEKPDSYGGGATVKSIKKTYLCEQVCAQPKKSAEIFENFRPTLDAISSLLGTTRPQSDSQTTPTPAAE